jgi:hypothetical protein
MSFSMSSKFRDAGRVLGDLSIGVVLDSDTIAGSARLAACRPLDLEYAL